MGVSCSAYMTIYTIIQFMHGHRKQTAQFGASMIFTVLRQRQRQKMIASFRRILCVCFVAESMCNGVPHTVVNSSSATATTTKKCACKTCPFICYVIIYTLYMYCIGKYIKK